MIHIKSIIHDNEYMEEVGRLAAEHHPENFGNFSKRIKNYVDFFICEHNSNIVAISGIYKCPSWPDNHYRVGDRSFYFPEFRTKGLNYLLPESQKDIRNLCSTQLIPKQIEIVCQMGGIPFYSMLNHPNALQRSVNLLNTTLEEDKHFIMLEDLYYTCPDPERASDRCWQNIAVMASKKQEFNLTSRKNNGA